MQLLAKFKKVLYREFRATLNFHGAVFEIYALKVPME